MDHQTAKEANVDYTFSETLGKPEIRNHIWKGAFTRRDLVILPC